MTLKCDDIEQIERLIVTKAVNDLISGGYRVSVFDSEEYAIKSSVSASAIMDVLFSTEEDVLNLTKFGPDGESLPAGWVRLVYGDGHGVISDCTVNLTGVLAGANKLSEEIQNGV